MQLPLNTQTQDSQKIKLCTFQVCVKLNQSTQNSFDFLRIFNNYLPKYYDLYHYNDNEVGERFQGKTISGKNVEKAREALQIYHTEMDDFQTKILATKRDSADAYDKMMEDLDNLKENKKTTKCIRSWSRVSASAVSNYNLEQAQSEIRVNMEKVQNEMKKLAETQDEILKALKSRSNSSPARRSTLHSRKSTY